MTKKHNIRIHKFGTAIKVSFTAKAIEDLEKAVWYINDKIKTIKNETNN